MKIEIEETESKLVKFKRIENGVGEVTGVLLQLNLHNLRSRSNALLHEKSLITDSF